ncbi:MAG: hypothetical protein CME64_03195 [Halobacteriovoraceae bacterium]|nr:hypothetical protein [Halobacteriovoraceae bacterium]|tara:strand:- start:4924 stop:5310 length:387 start_codon:yes stop_codon:yes gene_type:complete
MSYNELKGLHLWIVEDDQDLQDVWSKAMALYSIKCKTFMRGEDAIAALEVERKPDVLMCDYYLPGMNGEEIIKELFIKGGISPALLVTGKQEVQSTLLKMPDKLKFKILKKPVSIRTLLDNVSNLLSQ